MQLAIIDNNAVIKTGFYKELFPNVSFPVTGPTKEWMEENNIMEVSIGISHNRDIEKLEAVEPYILDNMVYTVKVVPLTPDDIENIRLSKRVMKVSMRQARLALLKEDLLTVVDSAIQDMTGEGSSETKITWEYATEIDRDNDMVLKLMEQLGWDDIKMDNLFTSANSL